MSVALLKSVALSAGFALLMIGGMFRSGRVVWAALLANAVPLAALCLSLWMFDVPFNVLTVCVLLVALGVIVDDTIQIIYAMRGDEMVRNSIEYSIVLTSLAIASSFLLLWLSAMPATQQFALQITMVIVVAVVSDLFLLPFLLGSYESPIRHRYIG